MSYSGVRLGLEPELVVQLDVRLDVIHGRFAGIVDKELVLRFEDGACGRLDLTTEERVPRLVAPVRGVGVRNNVGDIEFSATFFGGLEDRAC